jgi:hypothetical protein
MYARSGAGVVSTAFANAETFARTKRYLAKPESFIIKNTCMGLKGMLKSMCKGFKGGKTSIYLPLARQHEQLPALEGVRQNYMKKALSYSLLHFNVIYCILMLYTAF